MKLKMIWCECPFFERRILLLWNEIYFFLSVGEFSVIFSFCLSLWSFFVLWTSFAEKFTIVLNSIWTKEHWLNFSCSMKKIRLNIFNKNIYRNTISSLTSKFIHPVNWGDLVQENKAFVCFSDSYLERHTNKLTDITRKPIPVK